MGRFLIAGFLAVLAVVLAAEDVLAHGGRWLGGFDEWKPKAPAYAPPPQPLRDPETGEEIPPGDPLRLPMLPRPSSPGPGGGGPAAPGDPAPPPLPVTNDWSRWWNLSRERILRVRTTRDLQREAGARDDDDRDALLALLREAAKDPNPDLATGAILALGKARDRGAVPVLVTILGSETADATARESAALAIGMIGRPDPADAALLARMAADRSRPLRTRCFAAIGLGYTSPVEAEGPLLSLIGGEDENVELRISAVVALGLAPGGRTVAELSRRLAGEAGLRWKDARLRAHAAFALGLTGDRAAVPALHRALSDPDVDVRRQAVLSLSRTARIGDGEVIEQMFTLFEKDADAQVRALAAISLGEIGAHFANDSLLFHYGKRDATVTPYAALGLALAARKRGAGTAVPFLREQCAAARDPDLTGALVTALGIVKDRGSATSLLAILDAKDGGRLRGHAAAALGMIGAREAIPSLRKALADRRDPHLQAEAGLALALLGDDGAVTLLVGRLTGGDSESIRGRAAVALGRFDGASTRNALAKVLADVENPVTVRALAAVALGMVLERHPLPMLSRLGDGLNHRMASETVAEILSYY